MIEGLNPSREIAEFRQRLLGILANQNPMTVRQILEKMHPEMSLPERKQRYSRTYQQLRTMANIGTVVWRPWGHEGRGDSVFGLPLDTPPGLDVEGLEAWLLGS